MNAFSSSLLWKVFTSASIMKEIFVGCSSLGWQLFSVRACWEFAVVVMDLLFMWLGVFLLHFFNILSLSVYSMSSYKMTWWCPFLVLSVCSKILLSLNDHCFPIIWEIFCCYFTEHIFYAFSLPFFSFPCPWFIVLVF
jgi:hypothetical protein